MLMEIQSLWAKTNWTLLNFQAYVFDLIKIGTENVFGAN